jgi:hypothetical protein
MARLESVKFPFCQNSSNSDSKEHIYEKCKHL